MKTIKRTLRKVQIWIYCRCPDSGDTRFLMLLTQAKRGSFWQPVTGGVEANESLEAAALREAREETGLSFLGHPVRIGEPFEFESRGCQVIEYGFSVEARSDSAPKSPFPEPVLDIREHDEYRWTSAMEASQITQYPSNLRIFHALLVELELLSETIAKFMISRLDKE